MNSVALPVQQVIVHGPPKEVVWKRLPESVRSVIDAFEHRLQDYYGTRLNSIILYGSYARGDFNDDSDIDLLIIFADDITSKLQIANELAVLKYDLMIKYSVILSTKAVSAQTFVSGSGAIYHFIRKEGVLL